jgi:hypothetical protein
VERGTTFSHGIHNHQHLPATRAFRHEVR